jgi:uncharacterized membrane protein
MKWLMLVGVVVITIFTIAVIVAFFSIFIIIPVLWLVHYVERKIDESGNF